MRDLGDFQTPPGLVTAVLDRLGPVGTRWARVLEPTCGCGRFLAGLLALDPPPKEIHGVELQARHFDTARALVALAGSSVKVGLTRGDLFALDLAREPHWTEPGPLLVVGNPPWVTSAELGALGSANGPVRRNLRRAPGLEARTGASNFDLAEAVWLKLLSELPVGPEPTTVALLCKLAVARRVLEHAAGTGLPVSAASLWRVDARAWFGAAVEACLFSVTVGPAGAPRPAPITVPVYTSLDATEPASVMGLVRGRVVSDLDAYSACAHADGVCPLVWRQGVKHDAAGVMELTEVEIPGGTFALQNREGVTVEVEPEWVFPLWKATDLARPAGRPRRLAVLVTQRKVGDDTRGLAISAPRLWSYLGRNAAALERRRSSVYRNQPPYAMFGVGPYTFSPWKVAVSGLHPQPLFRCVGPNEGRPVLLDDTCYFVACRSPEQAALVSALANLPEATGLLRALGFPGAKRPVTKGHLQRLDLRGLLARADRPALLARAEADVERTAGREPAWPGHLESLLVE